MDPLAALLALIVILASAWERRNLLRAFQTERDTWRSERHVLLERIQRPTIPPPDASAPPRQITDEERQRIAEQVKQRAELAKVGQAQPLKAE